VHAFACVCVCVCVCVFGRAGIYSVCVCVRSCVFVPMWGMATHDMIERRRCIKCLQLHISFHKRATNHRALFRKQTYKDKASYASLPRCWLDTSARSLSGNPQLLPPVFVGGFRNRDLIMYPVCDSSPTHDYTILFARLLHLKSKVNQYNILLDSPFAWQSIRVMRS